jgi:hypothetical protein
VQEPIREEEAREVSLGADHLSAALRRDLRERVERIIREELGAALGAEPYERTPERRGYQHSPRERTITTGLGPVTFKTYWHLPPARACGRQPSPPPSTRTILSPRERRGRHLVRKALWANPISTAPLDSTTGSRSPGTDPDSGRRQDFPCPLFDVTSI